MMLRCVIGGESGGEDIVGERAGNMSNDFERRTKDDNIGDGGQQCGCLRGLENSGIDDLGGGLALKV